MEEPTHAPASQHLHKPWISTAQLSMEKTPLSFVTISRQSGCGGTRFAQALMEELHRGTATGSRPWSVYEGNLTIRMLHANQLSSRLARYLPEDKVSELSSLIGELVGLHPSLWDLIQKTNRAMCDLARQQNAILVGRGANFATRQLGGVHIRLVAPKEHRASYLSKVDDITYAQALALNARRDAARSRYVSHTFHADVDDCRNYDLVLNTAQVSTEEAVAMTIQVLKMRHCIGSFCEYRRSFLRQLALNA